MIAGAVALTVAGAAAIPAIRRWGAVWGSVLLWTVWIVVGAAAGVPVAGDNGRLFTVDFGSLREISPSALAMRFAYGAAISVLAGLVGVVSGQRAGGIMLAAPAVLLATLTIIERREGRGPAVTEAQG